MISYRLDWTVYMYRTTRLLCWLAAVLCPIMAGLTNQFFHHRLLLVSKQRDEILCSLG